ncbi:MAG: chalcone isomerase family protein [Gammaproteobacteria bacterium]|jgi:Chalcone isomerase-like|nr:chalcone isomerase family protein [Gammaproteobacteria bacterium]
MLLSLPSLSGITQVFFPIILFLSSLPVHALDIAGITVPDQACINHGNALHLNGAGTREKLFTDIYVGALYLPDKSHKADDIINSEVPRRIALYFVYKEVSATKLIEGWQDGFELNNDAQQLQVMESRLKQSYGYFSTMKSGDVIFLDYIPGQGTRLIINNELKGVIAGSDFYRAVLKIWLGEHPAQEELKQGMLGVHNFAASAVNLVYSPHTTR